MTFRWPDFQTRDLKVEMKTVPHDQALLFLLFACPAPIYFRSVVGLFVTVHPGTQFSLIEISSLLYNSKKTTNANFFWAFFMRKLPKALDHLTF